MNDINVVLKLSMKHSVIKQYIGEVTNKQLQINTIKKKRVQVCVCYGTGLKIQITLILGYAIYSAVYKLINKVHIHYKSY